MLHRFYVGIGNQSQGDSTILDKNRLATLNIATTFFGGATLLPTARGAWLDGPEVTIEAVDIYEVYTAPDHPYLARFHAHLKARFDQKEVFWLSTHATRRDDHD